MLAKFETYQLSLELYRGCENLKLPAHLRDQIRRSSLSICLNLAEGSAKPSMNEKKRFYSIAFGSCRETQALLEIVNETELLKLSDRVGACLYRLTYRDRRKEGP